MCGRGESGGSAVDGDDGRPGVSLLTLSEDGRDVEEDDVAAMDVVVSLCVRLAFEGERRMEGERSDSRAFGSCSCICRPIDGLCVT